MLSLNTCTQAHDRRTERTKRRILKPFACWSHRQLSTTGARKSENDGRAAMTSKRLSTRAQLTNSIDELLATFTTRAGKGAKPMNRPIARSPALQSSYRRIRNAAQALMRWHSSDDYLELDGSPSALPLRGRQSLTTLALQIAPDENDARMLLADLRTFGLIKKRHAGFVPRHRSAVVGEPNDVALTYATIAISRLINTIAHNYSQKGSPRFERQLSEVRIRKSDIPLFLRFVSEQGQYFIDAVDDWLAARQHRASSSDQGVSVGLGAFAWIDDVSRAKDATLKGGS